MSSNGRVDGCARITGAPRTDGIEVLERQAERVHHSVAARARRALAVHLHLLAHAARRLPLAFFERRDVGGRRRRRRAEQVVENPLAAQYRATCDRDATSGAGCSHARAARAAPSSVTATRAEVAAVDVRNSVVPRQPLVDERVVGGEQVEHAPVFRERCFETAARSRGGTPGAGCRRNRGTRSDPESTPADCAAAAIGRRSSRPARQNARSASIRRTCRSSTAGCRS